MRQGLFIRLPFVHALLNESHLVDVPFVGKGGNSANSGESAQKRRLTCVFASITSDTSVCGVALCIGFDISASFLCGSRAQNTILCATVDTFVSGKLFRYSILIFELYDSVSCAWQGALRKLNQFKRTYKENVTYLNVDHQRINQVTLRRETNHLKAA